MAMVVCILVTGLPWSFGPYNTQGYLLSRELDRLGYTVRWMVNEGTPERFYESPEDVMKNVGDGLRLPPIPPGFNLSHLKYVGINTGGGKLKVSHLNFLARRYGLDAYIVLMDLTTHVLRDADFKVTAIGWLPQHWADAHPIDVFTLKAFTHIAPLAPSAEVLMKPSLRPLHVKHIPHILEIDTVAELDGKPSSDTEDFELVVPPGKFVVLFQGGNYEPSDRKGVDIVVQAFERFHAVQPDSYLVFHAINSKEIAGDHHYNTTPPQGLRETGVPLHLRLAVSNLSDDAYWVETRKLATHAVYRFKRAANVCLHPSRTEGFGMNMLECQAVGTPVITTDFGAMGDFTRYGMAVPHRQHMCPGHGMFAQPNVEGVADALLKAYRGEEPWFGADKRAVTQQWIAQNFSSYRVGKMFQRMLNLKSTSLLLRNRSSVPSKLYTWIVVDGSPPPQVDIDTLWVLCAKRGAVLNEEGLSAMLREEYSRVHSADAMFAIPATRRTDQSKVPFRGENGQLHPDMPILMPTIHFLRAQQTVEHCHDMAGTVASQTGVKTNLFPDGLAFV